MDKKQMKDRALRGLDLDRDHFSPAPQYPDQVPVWSPGTPQATAGSPSPMETTETAESRIVWHARDGYYLQRKSSRYRWDSGH
jgi:hypothetical protein